MALKVMSTRSGLCELNCAPIEIAAADTHDSSCALAREGEGMCDSVKLENELPPTGS